MKHSIAIKLFRMVLSIYLLVSIVLLGIEFWVGRNEETKQVKEELFAIKNSFSKSFKNAFRIIENLLEHNFKRSDCVIAYGGGILGDLSAFVSNLTKRGLKFINIPTTLLAQVDASIGGKTGVNSNQGKNLIGTFYQPDFVISDVATLNSLPQREIQFHIQ